MALPPIEINVTADTKQAEASLKRVGDQAATAGQRVQGGASQMTAGTGQAVQGFNALGGQSRMLTQQLSQVAQQATATGQVGQALAVQAADIGLAFGTVGTVVGALVGITLPSLIAMFNSTGEEAARLADRVEEATGRIGELRLQARELRLGVSPEELALMDAIAEAQDRYNDALRMSQAPREQTAAIGRAQLETAREELTALQGQLRELQSLQTEITEIKEGSNSILENFQHLIPVAERFAMLTGEAADNVMAAARQATIDAIAASASPTGRGGAGPGGPLIGSAGVAMAALGGMNVSDEQRHLDSLRSGGQDTTKDDLERLQERLMSETELAEHSYNERLALLRTAREAELLTNQEFNTLQAKLAEDHAAELADIDGLKYGSALDRTQEFFAQSTAAFMSGNEKMVEIGRKFAKIEAVINAGRAFAQVAADPELPWFMKIPAAIGVASAISQFSNQSGIGGGAGAPSAAAPSAPQQAPSMPAQRQELILIGNNFNDKQMEQAFMFGNRMSENGFVIRGTR